MIGRICLFAVDSSYFILNLFAGEELHDIQANSAFHPSGYLKGVVAGEHCGAKAIVLLAGA